MELLTVKQFNLSVAGNQKIINSSFSVSSGDVVLLTGPNGCGKSTIIKVMMGAAFDYMELDYSGSTVLYNGKHDILFDERENELFRQSVCYVSQEDEFESDSVLDCFINSIDFAVSNQKEEFVFSFIKQFSIYECFGITANGSHLDRRSQRLLRALKIKRDSMSDEDAAALA